MTIADIPLSYTKVELIAALEALRPKAARTDAKNLATHRKAEAKHLAEFKRACRAALKWDYETLHKNGSYLGTRRSAPSCPRSEVSRLDSLLVMVKKLNQERFTISRNGRWSRIYEALTADVPEVKGLC